MNDPRVYIVILAVAVAFGLVWTFYGRGYHR